MPEERALVLCTVTSVRDVHIVYPCCNQCYTKMLYDFQLKSWWCVKCKYSCLENSVNWRYRLTLTVADDSAICNIAVFGTTVQEIVGCDAKQYNRLTRQYHEQEGFGMLLEDSLQEVFVGNYYYFGFKVSLPKGDKLPSHSVLETVRAYSSSALSCSTQTTQRQNKCVQNDIIAYQIIPVQEVKPKLVDSILKNLHQSSLFCGSNSRNNINISSTKKINYSPHDKSLIKVTLVEPTDLECSETFPTKECSLSLNVSSNFIAACDSIQISDRSSLYNNTGQTSIEFSCLDQYTLWNQNSSKESSVNSSFKSVEMDGKRGNRMITRSMKRRMMETYNMSPRSDSTLNKQYGTRSFQATDVSSIEQLRNCDSISTDNDDMVTKVSKHFNTISICDFSSSFETSSLMLACQGELPKHSSKLVDAVPNRDKECDLMEQKSLRTNSTNANQVSISRPPCDILPYEKKRVDQVTSDMFMNESRINKHAASSQQINKCSEDFITSGAVKHAQSLKSAEHNDISRNIIPPDNRVLQITQADKADKIAIEEIYMPDSEDLNAFLGNEFNESFNDSKTSNNEKGYSKNCGATDCKQSEFSNQPIPLAKEAELELPASEDLFAFLECESVDFSHKRKVDADVLKITKNTDLEMPDSEDLFAFLECESVGFSRKGKVEADVSKIKKNTDLEMPDSEDLFAFLECESVDVSRKVKVDADVLKITKSERKTDSASKISDLVVSQNHEKVNSTPCLMTVGKQNISLASVCSLSQLSSDTVYSDVSIDLFADSNIDDSDFNANNVLVNSGAKNELPEKRTMDENVNVNLCLQIEQLRNGHSKQESVLLDEDCDLPGIIETCNGAHGSSKSGSLLVCSQSPSTSIALAPVKELNRHDKRKSVHFARRMSVIKSIPLIDIQMKFASSPLDEHIEYKSKKKSCLKGASKMDNSLQLMDNIGSAGDADIFSQDLFSPISSVPAPQLTHKSDNIYNSFTNSPEFLSQSLVLISNSGDRVSPFMQTDCNYSHRISSKSFSQKNCSQSISQSKSVGSLSVTHSLFSDCSFTDEDKESSKTASCLSGASCLSCSLFSSSECDSLSTSRIHRRLFEDR